MKIAILSGTPKTEGLSASCVKAAEAGIRRAGGTVELIEVCKTSIERCHVCGDGWGICRTQHECAYGQDGFADASRTIREAGGLVIQTPVYWGEASEALKSFLDRLRRCEATREDAGALTGKKVLLIAAPGGSGGGLLSCLSQLERAVQHMRGRVFDYVGVNRWNKEYKLKAIEAAAEALCRG